VLLHGVLCTVAARRERMTTAILIILLTSMIRVSLPLRVDFTDPVFYRPPAEVRRILPAEAWGRRLGGGWSSPGFLDSATGGRSSWSRVYHLLRLLRSWQVGGGGGSAFHRAPDPPARGTPHRSVPYLVRDRGRRLLRVAKISRPEAVPDNDQNIDHIAVEAGGNRWKKSPPGSLAEAIAQGPGDEFDPSHQLPHPIYLGMGQDAVDVAYRTYISILSPETRNSRKSSVNPVNFVGRR